MARLPKDILKKLPGDYLEPGEELINLSWMERPGAGKALANILLLGNIAKVGSVSGTSDGTGAGPLAGFVPGGKLAVALTGRRLLIFAPGEGRKDSMVLACAFLPEHVSRMKYRGGFGESFKLTFADGSEVSFELSGVNQAKAFGNASDSFCRGGAPTPG